MADVLCINAGSSSVKAARFGVGPDGGEPELEATADLFGIGQPRPELVVRDASRHLGGRHALPTIDHTGALHAVLDALLGADTDVPVAVGHRIVHGGPQLTEHTRIDEDVLAALRAAVPLAPLHLPSALTALDAAARRFPEAVQVACFDTVFHTSMPEVARRLPIPTWLHEQGVHRYGFHGLSYEYVVGKLGGATLGRAVVAHLGSGASLAAIADGRSIDTTMAFTPSAGIPMGTRTGDLDPGVLIYLARTAGFDPDRMEQLVDRESGLKGVSGLSNDMAALLAARPTHPAAALAVQLFCYRVAKEVAALTVALGGLDTLVFTAGIGEHAPEVRAEVAGQLAHLGVAIDPGRNGAGAVDIAGPGSRVAVLVVPTDENLVMARHTVRLAST